MRPCPACGTPLENNSTGCPSCGHAIARARADIAAAGATPEPTSSESEIVGRMFLLRVAIIALAALAGGAAGFLWGGPLLGIVGAAVAGLGVFIITGFMEGFLG